MGFRAEQSSSSWMRQGCLLFFGLFWTGFSSIFLIVGLVNGEWAFIGIGGLFVLIGLVILGYGLMQLLTRYLVGKPEITLSNQHQLRVGEKLTVTWHHSFRRSVTVEKLQVQLILREIATYQQGTDTKTVTYNDVIDVYEEPGYDYSGGEMIQGGYDFVIPTNSMHTFKVRRNEIKWILQFKLDVANLPDYVDEYELTVLPQMVMNNG